MANLSDADVKITVEKVGEQFLNYLLETQKLSTDYAIVYDIYDENEVDENGNMYIHSSSSGRWAYSNNLEGYFDETKVKGWLGVDSDYTYMPEHQRNEYKERSRAQYEAFLALIKAIKEEDGKVIVDYTDNDTAMEWMGSGQAILEVVDGEVVFNHTFEEEDFTIEAFAEQQGESEAWAMAYIYGDEIADKYWEHVKEMETVGKPAPSFYSWYETHEEE